MVVAICSAVVVFDAFVVVAVAVVAVAAVIVVAVVAAAHLIVATNIFPTVFVLLLVAEFTAAPWRPPAT